MTGMCSEPGVSDGDSPFVSALDTKGLSPSDTPEYMKYKIIKGFRI